MQEVPELEDQTVVIEKIVRDGGYRTKLIVRSNNPKVDPVGACVGVRGGRVKNIIRDLNNEKIDIIPYSADPIELLQNILAPIQIRKIAFHEEDKVVAIVIDDADFAAVIGKKGMNARLTGELLGYTLEVQRISEYNKSLEIQRMQLAESDDPSLDQPLAIEGLNKLVIQNLQQSGLDTLRKLLVASINKTPEELAETIGISIDIVHTILEQVSKPKE
jgi:N utilization substance protein A